MDADEDATSGARRPGDELGNLREEVSRLRAELTRAQALSSADPAAVAELRAENARLRAEGAGSIPPRVGALYRHMAAQWRKGASVVPIATVRDILSGRGPEHPSVRMAERAELGREDTR